MVGRKIHYYCPDCRRPVESRNETQNDVSIDPEHESMQSIGFRYECGAGTRKCKQCGKHHLIIYEVRYEDGWKSPLTYTYSFEKDGPMSKAIKKYVITKMEKEHKKLPKGVHPNR